MTLSFFRASVSVRDLSTARQLDTANRLDPRVTRVTELFGGLLHRDGLAVNASSLGADQLFSSLVNSQARLLAFIDVFWVLQLLGVAGIVLLLIRRCAPNAEAEGALTLNRLNPWSYNEQPL